MVGKTVRPTAAQKRRLDAVAKMHCVACEIDRQAQPNDTEVQHLVDKGTRRASGGHDATIPLCKWHHRGVPSYIAHKGSTAKAMTAQYGPSMELQGRAFIARYGTQRELLAIVNRQLESVTN